MTEIRNKIDQILEERLPGTKSEDIADKKVISVGMDSIQMMLFNKSIQDEFKVQIPFSVYFGSTLNEIIQYIAENTDIHENNKAENAVLETVIPDETDEMTDLQYSYWIGSRSERNFGGFMPNICFEARVDGIDVERLETSLNYMIRKHKMLQSTVTDDAKVRAVSYNDYRIRVNDLSEMSEDRQESELKKIRERLKDISYTFNKWPWFTVEYSDLGNGNGVLHIEIELILFDIWSIRIFLEEWYDIYKNGDKNDVPGITYGQYTAYLRNRNSSEQYETDRRYWESRITEFTEPPKLPMKNGGKDFDKRFCHLSYVISDDIWSKLTEKSRIYNVTPTAVLLTAYAKILRKWSENKSFILNMTAFDRDMIHKDMGRLIGEFTNTFLIQAEENKGIRFADEVKENQRQVFEGINHRSYNGIAVLRDIAKKRKISPFDCIAPFVFTCALTGDNDYKLNPGENFFGRFEQYSRTPQVLVDCQLFEFDGHLNLVWDYADKVFPDGMISSMYKELIRYLEKIADSSWDGAVDYILSDKICAGYKKLNDTADTEMNTGLMFSDFIGISEKNPDRTAVVSGNVRITYGQLRKSAFVIAEKLSDMGVKAGDAVLIHTERGWKEIASALGILIAGGAYVGVRKNDSTERKQLIAEKCGADVIITDTASMGICKSELLIGDEYIKAAPVSEQKIKGHIADIRKDSLAYVIFTSGSTGEPKGVQITHESAMNTIYAVNRKFEIGQSDAVIAISALQFDLSVYDIFGMLSSGGKIVTVPSERKSDPEFWLELAEKENITVWNSVPALFEMLVETMELHKKGYHFRKVLLSGDWIPLDLPKRYWKFCTEADIYSLGGATEASIWSNYYPVKYIDENWKSIPYGYPLENQTMYVLDNELALCPPYVEGDIYIGGKGTALGYIGDKEKTDAVFITHHESGERIYKTGDRGYLSDEGYIVFMGRNDRQIKLNGYRIELDEIRNVIESVSGVKKAIVVKKTAGSGNAVLAAYYVRKAEGSDGAGKITASDVTLLTSFEERLSFKISHHNERTDLISDNTIQLRDRNNSSDILRRLSTRNFSAVHISYEEISTVLSQLKIQEIFGGTHSIYATAGGVYPVQIYIAVNDNFADGIKGGVYYFNQRKNTLVMTDSHTDAFDNICVEGNRTIAENAAFAMFFVSDMSVITPLYGNRSRDFCLIECGLIAQTVERICSENGLATCQIGSWTNEQSLFKSMKLNSENEILHMMYLGKADLCDTARAFIVQKNISDLIEKECRKRLPSYEIPAFITEINEIPLTSNGKVDEKRLAEVSENVPQSVEKVTATDDITERVYNIYLSNSGQDKLRTDQNIWEAGINSLAATKIWRQLQENFGISFNIAVIFEKATIINMAEYVKSLLNNKKANEPAIADNETEKFLKRNELRKNAVRRHMQRG